ncbi:MAG: molybdopterin-binding protein, partial [Corynebacterium sp.]|nr:molybdopterin-binding protein [Corynebacterium sp.]
LCHVHHLDVAGTVQTTDNPTAFRAALSAAIDKARPDAVVTSGGISHGAFEVVRQTLEHAPGAWFGHVAQQPGGPQGLARFEGVPVICLPGNPVSTAVSFRLFVAPALGESSCAVTARITAAEDGLADKDRYLRGRTQVRDGELTVRPVGGAGSHLLAQSVTADALIRVPAGATLAAGTLVEVYPLDR